MKTYTGRVTRLGNFRVDREGTRRYSMIDIGNASLRNVVVDEYLDNYLVDCLRTGQEATIIVASNGLRDAIASIRIGGETRKAEKLGSFGTLALAAIGVMVISAGIIFFPLMLFGGWLLWGAWCRFKFNQLVA